MIVPWQLIAITLVAFGMHALISCVLLNRCSERTLEQIHQMHRDALSQQKQNNREALIAYRESYQAGLIHGKKDSKKKD